MSKKSIPKNLVDKVLPKELTSILSKIKNKSTKSAVEKAFFSKFLKQKSGETRIETIRRLVKNANELAKRKGAFNKTYYGMSRKELPSFFINESLDFKSSLLTNLDLASGETFKEKYLNAEKLTYKDRTENFMKTYGDEEAKYNGEIKLMSEWFEDYLNGKISKEDMNNIIEDFKSYNPEYMETDYRANNFEQKEATAEEAIAKGI